MSNKERETCKFELDSKNFCVLHSNLSNDNVISAKGQALVIQSLDSAIQQINLYPVDSAFSFPIT